MIVLGLGNPGTKYLWTRHNLGFRVVDRLCRGWKCTLKPRGDLKSMVWAAEVRLPGQVAILAKPRTYMNRVGRAASILCEHYGVAPADLLAVYDDADLELGRVRIRYGGGAGGHNGIRSMIAALRTEAFPRIRLGIRGAGRSSELEEYVLEEFEEEEKQVAEALVELGADAGRVAVEQGLEDAMNRFNGRTVGLDQGNPDGSEEDPGGTDLK